jgi:hypothetical protein
MPNGMEFRTDKKKFEKGRLKGRGLELEGSTNEPWSVVMMTDCAAVGTLPRRAAASATISKAALNVRESETGPE